MKRKLLLINSVIFFSGYLSAQENTTSAGQSITSSGGSVSYSIGQIDYETIAGSNGSMTLGVQQPYEIFSLSISEEALNYNINVYPNPATELLTIQLDEALNGNATYRLIDASGKLLDYQSISSVMTNIDVSKLAVATYFLTISNQNGVVKTFKINKTTSSN